MSEAKKAGQVRTRRKILGAPYTHLQSFEPVNGPQVLSFLRLGSHVGSITPFVKISSTAPRWYASKAAITCLRITGRVGARLLDSVGSFSMSNSQTCTVLLLFGHGALAFGARPCLQTVSGQTNVSGITSCVLGVNPGGGTCVALASIVCMPGSEDEEAPSRSICHTHEAKVRGRLYSSVSCKKRQRRGAYFVRTEPFLTLD